MGVEGERNLGGIYGPKRSPFKGPVNSAVVKTLEGRKHVIQAKQKINNLSKTKEDALRLVEICENLRQRCIELEIDFYPSYIDESRKNTWLQWDMYKIEPYNTQSMKQIFVNGKAKRVSKVFIRKIPMYQRFANHMIDLLDRAGVTDFGL